MFNEAAKKFFEKFQLGKVYFISRGTLKVANKQFKTVQNDYEMTLNENSEVEEASNEETFIPETKFNFVPIDELGPYVNQKELVGEMLPQDCTDLSSLFLFPLIMLLFLPWTLDIIGVVQSVSPTMSIRRKSDNEIIPKRDITVADETYVHYILLVYTYIPYHSSSHGFLLNIITCSIYDAGRRLLLFHYGISLQVVLVRNCLTWLINLL